MGETLKLRAHHLLCSVLYKGRGYSSLFNKNMTCVVDNLRKGCMVELGSSPDAICTDCPNLKEDGSCRLDENKCKNIMSLDESVLSRFGFQSGEVYASQKLYRKIRNNCREDDFDLWCQNCRWRKEGLCSYSEYMERINSFTGE